MKIHLNIYGVKMYVTVNAVCRFMYKEKFIFSGESDARLKNPIDDVMNIIGHPVMEPDNEVCMLLSVSDPQEGKENLKQQVAQLIDKLAKVFKKDEKLYVISNLRYGKDNSELLEQVMAGYSSSISDGMGARLEKMPLTRRDFENLLAELKNPTRAGQELDPFIIEKRRLQTREFFNVAKKLNLGHSFYIYWMLEPEATELSYRKVIGFMSETQAEMRLAALKKPEFKKFLNLVNTLRADEEWVDPMVLIRDTEEMYG